MGNEVTNYVVFSGSFTQPMSLTEVWRGPAKGRDDALGQAVAGVSLTDVDSVQLAAVAERHLSPATVAVEVRKEVKIRR